MRKKKKKEEEAIHAYYMAGLAVAERAIAGHIACKVFNFISHLYYPIPFSTAGIYPKIPFLRPQLLPYCFQCLHCSITNDTLFMQLKIETQTFCLKLGAYIYLLEEEEQQRLTQRLQTKAMQKNMKVLQVEAALGLSNQLFPWPWWVSFIGFCVLKVLSQLSFSTELIIQRYGEFSWKTGELRVVELTGCGRKMR